MTSDFRAIIDPESVTEALAGAGLIEPSTPGLELDRAWPIWGGGLCALFRGGDGFDGSWGLVSAHPGLPAAVRSSLTTGRAVLLPRSRAFAFPFPSDPRLPRLAEMSDRSRIRNRLREWLPTNSTLKHRVRAYKPLYRAVLECRHGERPAETLFVKMQTRYGAAATRRVHESLRAAAPDSRLALAHPIGGVGKWRANVWRGVGGVSLRELLHRGRADLALATAARDLARLHALRPELDRVHDRDRELETVAAWVEVASAAFPERRRELCDLEVSLAQIAALLPRPRLAVAHRDFHDEQILFDGERSVLLDLDTLCHGEPEIDLGNFLAHLDLQDLPPEAGHLFLAAYVRGARDIPRPEVIDWYRAASLLRLACVYALRRDGARRLPSLLEKAGRSLERPETDKEVSIR